MKLRTILAAPIAVVAAGLLLSAVGQDSQIAGTATVSAAAAVASPVSGLPGSPPAKAAGPAVGVAEAGALGKVIVGANGNTLYAFTKDVAGVSTCFDACAAAWPALTVDQSAAGWPPLNFAAPAGVDAKLVTTVDRPDGSKQVKIGKWPLYFYAGDGGPGETNGQGVGGVWFAVGADGKLIKGDAAATAASTTTPAPKTAPAPKSAPVPADDAPAVALAEVGNLGEVMVGANGHTLYASTDDPAHETTCFGACAKAWPPLTVPEDFTISDELRASGASTIERPDGSRQLVMGKWALYYYAGDGAPGEANGQGLNGKSFAIDGNCKLVKDAA